MDQSQTKRYVFGPVPSRRLGRSLGVDLVPINACSFDCIYCQLGRTGAKTTQRDEYAPLDRVVSDLRECLTRSPRPDYITLSGSGEPTLYGRLGELIEAIKTLTPIPVAILTNGSLFSDPQVRVQCNQADLVLPSLDAGDEQTFLTVNRPAADISFDGYVEGLRQFCRQRTCAVWLEVFVLSGINDSPRQMNRIRNIVDTLRVDRVQLNTAVRPTAEGYAMAVAQDTLEQLAGLFDPPAEIIADFPHEEALGPELLDTEAIVEMLRRRPCRAQDISAGLALSLPAVIKGLEHLQRDGQVRQVDREGQTYFVAG